ncbi:MAG: hypothetical protein ACOX6T_17510 [Myxococcales bacterium]|jgi:hypothetical protein
MLACLLLGLLGSLGAGPPLASTPEVPSVQAARAMSWQSVPAFDARRLRFSGGVQLQDVSLRSPGGGAVGGVFSAALEQGRHELATTLALQLGIRAQDESAQNTGIAGSHLKLAYRLVAFAGEFRVLVEVAAQAGYERSWAWCTDRAGVPQCGFVPGRLSYAGMAGPVFHWRLGPVSLLLGLDLMLRAPRLPEAIGASPLALQAWAEAGFGGLPW